MWQISFSFFTAMVEACIVINAVIVYVLHDVESDKIGNLNSGGVAQVKCVPHVSFVETWALAVQKTFED